MTGMRRVVAYPGRIAVEQADIPFPARMRPWSAPLAAGICGSDLHAAHGRHPLRPVALPAWSRGRRDRRRGRLRRRRRWSGRRVVWNPTCPAGRARCAPRAGRTSARTCSSSAAVTRRAAWPTTSPCPRTGCTTCRTRSTTHAAALIEPLSTPVHAARLAGDVAGRSVAVLGAGTIGLLLLAVLRAHGAGRIVVTDPLPGQARAGHRARGHVTVDARLAGRRRPGPRRARRERRRRLRLRGHPVLGGPGDRHGRQGRHGGGRRRPGADGHRPAADRAGPPDPHPGQRHLPAGGLRRSIELLDTRARSGARTSSPPPGRWSRSPRPSSWPRRATT